MRFDDELKREVPSTLGELRSYFADADPNTLGGDIEKSNIMATIDLLIDAAPQNKNSSPSLSFTELVRMVLSKAKEFAAAARPHSEAAWMNDLEILVEGAKMIDNPTKMIAVAARIEQAAGHHLVKPAKAVQARALAMSLRQHANKLAARRPE